MYGTLQGLKNLGCTPSLTFFFNFDSSEGTKTPTENDYSHNECHPNLILSGPTYVDPIDLVLPLLLLLRKFLFLLTILNINKQSDSPV